MSRVKTLTAKNPSEARGIRKALRAVGMKFEFKTAGKKRRAKRNPVKKKKASAKRSARRTRSKSRRRR